MLNNCFVLISGFRLLAPKTYFISQLTLIFNILLRFLYQIFPGTTLQCQRLLFKAAKTGELDTVQKLVCRVTL